MTNVRGRAESNKRLECTERGCSRRRTWTCLRCRICQLKKNRHGHARGRAIAKQEYIGYLTEVRKLFEHNPNEPGLHAATVAMAACLAPGPEPKAMHHGPNAPRYHRWLELNRLVREGVEPREALALACAIWAYSTEQPARIPGDARCSFAIANAIFKMANLRRRSWWNDVKKKPSVNTLPPSAGALALLGQDVQNKVGVFMTKIVERLADQKRRQNDMLSAMWNADLVPAPPKRPRTRRSDTPPAPRVQDVRVYANEGPQPVSAVALSPLEAYRRDRLAQQ